MAAVLDSPAQGDYEQRVAQAETEIDNFRGAFGRSLENSETEQALTLASSLLPLWLIRGRMREGRAWFDTAFGDASPDLAVTDGVRARSLADKAALDVWVDPAAAIDQAQQALTITRDLDDPALLVRALTAFSYVAGYSYNSEAARPLFAEGIELARALDDRWALCRILDKQAISAIVAGDPSTTRTAAEEARDLADAIGDGVDSRESRQSLGWAQLTQGDLVGAATQFEEVVAEAIASHDLYNVPGCHQGLGTALAFKGDLDAARAAGRAAIDAAAENGGFFLGLGHGVLALAALAEGDIDTAQEASETAWQHMSVQPQLAAAQRAFNQTEVALAQGDVATAGRLADEAVAAGVGWHLATALTARARVAMAANRREDAERDAYDALVCAADVGAYVALPGNLECLATLAKDNDRRHQEAARLFGAAEAFRQRTGVVRFKVHQAGYEASVEGLRDAMGDKAFEAAWAEGEGLSTEEAIAYALRGRGERKRRQQRLGVADPRGTRRCTSGQRRAWQQGRRRKAFHLTTHRAGPPHSHLHHAWADLPRATGPGSNQAWARRSACRQEVHHVTPETSNPHRDYPQMAAERGRVEPAPRRVRGYVDNTLVFDTTRAKYVWELPYYPQYYIPVSDVGAQYLHDEDHPQKVQPGTSRMHSLIVGDRTLGSAARVFDPGDGPVAGHVRFDWDALDWFEEDERIIAHPRNPYVRVDALRSHRHLNVALDGVTLADTHSPVLLFETGLPTRYYVDRTDVAFEHLESSQTQSVCPYKGITSGYWSVRVGATVHPDLAWTYDTPLQQVAPIAGLIAFYNEKLDLIVDGVALPRPQTHFA